MSIPDSRVWQSRAHKETLQKLNRTDKKMQGPFKYSQNNGQLIYSWKLGFEVERTSSRSQILDRDVNFYMKHCLFEPETKGHFDIPSPIKTDQKSRIVNSLLQVTKVH